MPVKKGLIQLYDAKALMISAIERQSVDGASTSVPGPFQTEFGQVFVPIADYPYRNDIPEDTETINRISCPVRRLWLAVIEQAVFDAHLHTTGGNYPSVIWVDDARKWFNSERFEYACEVLDVSPDWVRCLNYSVEGIARKLRGSEYDDAVKPKLITNKPRQLAVTRQWILI